MKPKIACCSIVKNEEEVLERMINSVRFMVDKFIIADTGSTDSTKEIIKRYGDLHEIPFEDFVTTKNKLLELPVTEELQMGISIGLSLSGITPISIYPRWNFLLLATNQIVNHLDKISLLSNNEYMPKVIIRTSIGSERPLHPQHQHVGDFTESFKLMCKNIEFIVLKE